MIFKVSLDLSGVPTVPFETDAEEAFLNNLEFSVVVAAAEKLKQVVCTRDHGNYKLLKDGVTDSGFVLEYDDFEPGSTLELLPAWYNDLKSYIVCTSAAAVYGCEQKLEVSEGLSYNVADAKVRHIPSSCGSVYTVRIVAYGKSSLVDASRLHRNILSGEAYKK